MPIPWSSTITAPDGGLLYVRSGLKTTDACTESFHLTTRNRFLITSYHCPLESGAPGFIRAAFSAIFAGLTGTQQLTARLNIQFSAMLDKPALSFPPPTSE